MGITHKRKTKENMRIALLTIWHVKNYGAELQTYATVKTLQEMEHEVCVIDFRLFETPKRTSLVGRILDFAHNIAPANRKFERFWKKNIPSTRHYTVYDELKKDVPDADLYLVGSDQVWNPEITKEKALAYFLGFVPKHKLTASYASSFGTESWNASVELTEKVQERLSSFKSVASREKQGVAILKDQFGIDAKQVLDPSLLRTDYAELTGKIKTKPTLAYYQLTESPNLAAFAQRRAEKMGLKYNDINKKSRLTSTFVWNRNSLEQWIRAIAESSFVITHSFHGLAMCLVHHRPFVVVYETGNRISRIASLLDIVGLRDRLFISIKEAEASDIWNKEIDWKKVDALLQIEKELSLNYLRDITKC